jgi:hypothetical protein
MRAVCKKLGQMTFDTADLRMAFPPRFSEHFFIELYD